MKLIAIEVADLLDAVDKGTSVEVGPEEGLAAVALVMACHESSEIGRPVRLKEVLDGSLCIYQVEANRALGI